MYYGQKGASTNQRTPQGAGPINDWSKTDGVQCIVNAVELEFKKDAHWELGPDRRQAFCSKHIED